MTCQDCGKDILAFPCKCGYQPASILAPSRHPQPFLRSTYHAQPNGISLEEFGVDLFEAIKCVGGIQALDEQILNHKFDAVKRAAAQSARANLLLRLKECRDKLSIAQTLEFVDRYPWVAHV